jgi:hypothetical protein
VISKAAHSNTDYRYKYITDFLNVGNKLLNTEIKETKNGHTGDLINTQGISFLRLPIQVMTNLSSWKRQGLFMWPEFQILS